MKAHRFAPSRCCCRFLFLFLASALLAGWADATHAGALGALRLPAEYRTFTVTNADDEELTITQIAVPIVGSLRLGGSADLVVSGAGASSSFEDVEGAESTLSGPTDVVSQLFVRLLSNRLLLQGGANLPSGKRELTGEELAVLQAISHPLLGFRLKDYGRGFDVSGGGAFAFPLGSSASFGFGAGYIQHGAFTLQENGDEYKPAWEGSCSAGLDFGGQSGRSELPGRGGAPLRLDGSIRYYGRDKLDGLPIFEEGNQVEAMALVQSSGSGARAWASGRFVTKADNQALSTDGAEIVATKIKPGRNLLGAAGVEFGITSGVRLGVEGEVHQFDGSDTVGLDGQLLGGGPSLSFLLGNHGSLRLSGRAYQGTLDGAVDEAGNTLIEEYDLSGIVVTAGLFWRGR